MELFLQLEKGLWAGFAALGFAVLFNVPRRTLVIIWLIGALGGFAKFFFMDLGLNIVVASLFSAALIGFISVYAAHIQKSPPLIFSIPSVIPMVPGAFAYRMMLGFMKLVGEQTDSATYIQTLADTTNNGLKAFFILMALAAGVSIPMLITRKETFKRTKRTDEQS